MNYVTCVITIKDGIGYILQYILSCYFFCKINNLKFVYTPIKNIEHMTWDGYTSQEEWDNMWNNYIINVFLPREDVLLIDEIDKNINIVKNCLDFFENTLYVLETNYFGKDCLDTQINKHSYIMEKLRINYLNNNNIISYYDKSKINIAVHMRRYTNTDCDPSSFRELYVKGGQTDLYFYSLILNLIDLLKCKEKQIEFHIFTQLSKDEDNSIFDHYFNLKDKNVEIILHKGTNCVLDLYHMITSDIFVLSKSSMSAIANYYRNGISIIRNSFHHTLKEPFISINSYGSFSEEQKTQILNNNVHCLILMDKQTSLTDPDQHYFKPYFDISKKNSNVKIVTFGNNNIDYDFIYGEDIFKIINNLYKDKTKPIIYHLVIWREIPLVSNLEKYDGVKIIDIEDCHDISYIYKHMDYFNTLTYRYESFPISLLKSKYPTYKFFYLPHSIDTEKFKDYNQEKQYDILVANARNSITSYHFRNRIKNILEKSKKYKIKYSYDATKCNFENFSKLINSSWLTISTPTIFEKSIYTTDFLFKKFIEIPMSKGVVLGYLPTSAKEDYNNNYVHIDENMSDEEIINIIDNALSNKELLQKYSEETYEIFRNKYSFENNYNRFMNILYEC